MNASAARIYELAHCTERWPEFLPHYRFVRVIEDDGIKRTVEMAARRGAIPLRWTAVQSNDPNTYGIHFLHIRGWTRGMNVDWILEEHAGRTKVSIVHDVVFHFPIARKLLEQHLVTHYFIEGIASRTLACIKSLVEDNDLCKSDVL